MTELGDRRRARLAAARLYLVCDRAFTGEGLRGALSGGVDIVQLRDKDATGDELLEAAAQIAPRCRNTGALFVVNDRPDLVAAAGADGVHLGQDDMPVSEAREIVGEDVLIGLSTHTPAQVEAANDSGADYIGVGPVFTTPTKPGRPAVGVGLVTHAAAHAQLPFFAIGDIRGGTIDAVVAAGARRVAVVRALTEAGDPVGVAHALRGALRREAVGGTA